MRLNVPCVKRGEGHAFQSSIKPLGEVSHELAEKFRAQRRFQEKKERPALLFQKRAENPGGNRVPSARRWYDWGSSDWRENTPLVRGEFSKGTPV